MVSRLLCLAIAWDGRVSFKLRKILLSPAHPSIPSSNFLAQSSFMSSPKSSSGKLQTPLMLYENHRLNILFSGSSTCHDCNITIVYSLNCRPYVRILCRLYGRKTTRAVPSDTLAAMYTVRVRYGKCPYNSRKMYGRNRIRLRWPALALPIDRRINSIIYPAQAWSLKDVTGQFQRFRTFRWSWRFIVQHRKYTCCKYSESSHWLNLCTSVQKNLDVNPWFHNKKWGRDKMQR